MAASEPFAQVPVSVLSLPGEAVKLYALLDRRADDTGHAWPSRSTLAGQMGCSTDKIDRLLKMLSASGSITVEKRRDDAGDPTSNLYGVAARMRPGSRTDAGTPPQGSGHGGRTDAATGSRTDAARIESQFERKPRNEKPRRFASRTEQNLAVIDAFIAERAAQ